jgi:hypothetical protein
MSGGSAAFVSWFLVSETSGTWLGIAATASGAAAMASATFECPAFAVLLPALLRAVGTSCFLLHFAEGAAEAVVLATDGTSLRADELSLLRCCCCCCCCLLLLLLRDILSEHLREDCDLCLRCCCCCCCVRDRDFERDRARRVERERLCDRSCMRELRSGVRERERECLLEGGS